MTAASGAAVSAQRVCKPATAEARSALMVFFMVGGPYDRQRQSLGITATRVEDLQPLSDVTDAVLCARLDSLFSFLPAYYYRAGNYILGTNYVYPWPIKNHYARSMAVFDSLGHEVPPPDQLIDPVGLHVVTMMSGLVTLAWNNFNANATTYRLQRSTGNGNFASVGGVFSASATSTVDTTAVTGNTYRYRLVTYRVGSDSGYSNTITVSLVGRRYRRPHYRR